MTKQEKAMMNDLVGTVQALTERIERLEAVNKKNIEVISLLLQDYQSRAKKITYIQLDGTEIEIDVEAAKTQAQVLKSKSNTTPTTVESKDSKPAPKSTSVTVGNLIFDGKYVKTGTGFMNSKTRYAIGKSITDNFGGIKLAKGNPIYDKCRKEDKFVQVYEFKSVEDCKKFMEEQQKRVG